jgi:hypothetical protein
MLITIVNVGKKMAAINPLMNEKQAKDEAQRPPRRALEEIYSVDKYSALFE